MIGIISKAKWHIRMKLRKVGNRILSSKRKKRLKTAQFTILSNNCWAGHVYRYFGLPYQTPTVGLYFFAADYVKFVADYKYYLQQPLEFINAKESRYYDVLVKRNHENKPIGKLDDVEIVFLHYKDEQEAIEKWKRRVARINWDNVLIKNSMQNYCTYELLKKYDKIPIKNKIVFVNKHMPEIESAICYKAAKRQNEVSEDVLYFNRYINITQWLNEGV